MGVLHLQSIRVLIVGEFFKYEGFVKNMFLCVFHLQNLGLLLSTKCGYL